jgi:hypothetical protein
LAETNPHASSFDSLLNESQALFCDQLRAAIAAMLDKSDEALTALIGETHSREAQEPYQEARQVLLAQRAAIETQFHQNFLSEFTKHTSVVKEPGQSFSELDQSLELVGEEDLEETLKFKAVAAKLRRFCDEELAALDQRVGVLLGDANLAAEQNPFGPEAVCDAYQITCHGLETDAKVRGVLLKLFDDHVIDQVRSIYKAVNTLLVKNSILPKIRYGVSKKADDKHAAAAERDEHEDKAAPDEQNLFAMLQNLVAGGAGGGGGGGVALPPGAVVLQGAELLGSLTKLQQGDASAIPGGFSGAAAAGAANVLHELKASSFGAGLMQMDATTLDIVAMLFDQLFDDPDIPAALKGLIGRLQIPMLKVAISDKSFFAKKTHPARQMLDTFGDIAVRLPADFGAESPTFVHLEAIVQHLLDNFQDDIGIFESVRGQLQEVVAEHDKRIEAEVAAQTRGAVERIEQTENLSVAKTAAEDEVKVRIQAHKLPGFVLEFLVEHWLRLLLLVHAKFGRASPQWKEAVETMDQLIWSVEPRSTLEERKKLATVVPALVRHLIGALDALGVPAEKREPFFAELMKHHTAALEPKKAKADATKAAAPASKAPAALDFSAPVTVRNPYGKGEIQVTGLDFTPQPVDKQKRAAAKQAIASSMAVDPPADMIMGVWVDFRPKTDGEAPRKAKLLFVSPKKTRYLFSDRGGKDILELSRAEMVRRLRTREAVRLDDEPVEPLFERIMHGVVGKLRTPAAQPAKAT